MDPLSTLVTKNLYLGAHVAVGGLQFFALTRLAQMSAMEVARRDDLLRKVRFTCGISIYTAVLATALVILSIIILVNVIPAPEVVGSGAGNNQALTDDNARLSAENANLASALRNQRESAEQILSSIRTTNRDLKIALGNLAAQVEAGSADTGVTSQIALLREQLVASAARERQILTAIEGQSSASAALSSIVSQSKVNDKNKNCAAPADPLFNPHGAALECSSVFLISTDEVGGLTSINETLPFMHEYAKYQPLVRFGNFNLFSTITPPGSALNPALCTAMDAFVAGPLTAYVNQVETLVTQANKAGYTYIVPPAYSVGLRPWLDGTRTFTCNTSSTVTIGKTYQFLGGRSILKRWPKQRFVALNPGTPSWDRYPSLEMARLQDVNTGNYDSTIDATFAAAFGVSIPELDLLGAVGNQSSYKVFLVTQAGDDAAVGVSDFFASLLDGHGITNEVKPTTYSGTQFLGLAAIASQIFANKGTVKTLIVISSNGGLTGEIGRDLVLANFFNIVCGGISNCAANGIVFVAGNYVPTAPYALPVPIISGLVIISPQNSEDAILANYVALPGQVLNGSVNYLEMQKWVSNCYQRLNMPEPRPYSFAGHQYIFPAYDASVDSWGSTLLYGWLQLGIYPANSFTIAYPDRGLQQNALIYSDDPVFEP